jgi:hypothetical protein
MPDYYLVLSEAVLKVFSAYSEQSGEIDDKGLRAKAMLCLNNMKWAMIRSEQWEEEYDEEITTRLKQAGYHEIHLKSWGVTDKVIYMKLTAFIWVQNSYLAPLK